MISELVCIFIATPGCREMTKAACGAIAPIIGREFGLETNRKWTGIAREWDGENDYMQIK